MGRHPFPTTGKLERFCEVDNPALAELRRRVKEAKPHVPQPGDADYQTPEQVAWIRGEDDEEG